MNSSRGNAPSTTVIRIGPKQITPYVHHGWWPLQNEENPPGKKTQKNNPWRLRFNLIGDFVISPWCQEYLFIFYRFFLQKSLWQNHQPCKPIKTGKFPKSVIYLFKVTSSKNATTIESSRWKMSFLKCCQKALDLHAAPVKSQAFCVFCVVFPSTQKMAMKKSNKKAAWI